jgi:hypothetical protein
MVSQRSALAGPQTLSRGPEHPAVRALEPGLRATLAARVFAARLNRALIAGEDPAGSRQLVARSRQLTAPSSRAALAGGLSRLLSSAQAPSGRLRVRGNRQAVCANASALGSLAILLTSPTPLYARGVAALEELLSDGNGPAYRGDSQTLAHMLEECRAALYGA